MHLQCHRGRGDHAGLVKFQTLYLIFLLDGVYSQNFNYYTFNTLFSIIVGIIVPNNVAYQSICSSLPL